MLPMLVGVLSAGPKNKLAEKLSGTEQARAATLADQATSAHQAKQDAAREVALAAKRVQSRDHLRALESRIDEAEAKLEDAATAQEAAEEEVVARSKDLSGLLPIALRLSLFPAETLLATPGTPEGAINGLSAMQGISIELSRQATALRAEQQMVRARAASVKRQCAALSAEGAHEAQEATVLDEQISQADQDRARALGEAAVAAKTAAALAAQAQDLRSAIEAVDKAERRAAEKDAQVKAALDHRGRRPSDTAMARQAGLSRPAGPALGVSALRVRVVTGRVTRKWRETAEDGPSSGITYGTASGGFVVSPCAGRVAFAAPFRTYGRLVIIECGQGLDFVLAGMDRVDAKVGLLVQPGEPVGRMRRLSPGSADTPLLYVELRKNGEPINPSPYLDEKP